METSSQPRPARARQSHPTTKLGKKAGQRRGNRAALRLLHEWLNDESGYDEETWPQLKQALESNRSSSSRTLFHD